MTAAANFVWANRQLIGQAVRAAFQHVCAVPAEPLGLRLVYDLSHNIAKLQQHLVEGHPLALCVHRKGATRAFPAGHPHLPAESRAIGQAVLIPDDMGRCSYVALGAAGRWSAASARAAMAGRALSRHDRVARYRTVPLSRP